MKRLFSFFLAVVIGWGSVTQPARAFAPPLIFAAYMTASTGAGTYTLAAVAGAIGITGLYFTIKDAQDNAVRIPLGDKPENQPPAPAATATIPGTSVSPAQACAAAVSSQPQTMDGYCYQYPASISYSVTSSSWVTVGSQALCSGTRTLTAQGGGCNPYTQSYNFYAYPGGGGVTCPAGYTVSGSNCVLQNAREATDDKACDLLYAQGAFATASDMNCGANADGTKVAPMIRDGKVIAYGTNSSGQPLMWEVTPGAQTITVKEYQQIQTATQTQIKTTTATIDATTSAVTSVQTQTAPGSMSSPSASAAPTVTTDPTTATNTPTVTQDQTKPADSVTCGLPGTPACAIDDTQFDGKDNFSIPRNSEINDKLDQNKTQLENSKDSIPTIGTDWLPSLMPGNVTACAPLVFDFTLHNRITGTLDAPNVQLDICDKLELVRAILGYMLGLWTVWYVWRRFTNANQGA